MFSSTSSQLKKCPNCGIWKKISHSQIRKYGVAKAECEKCIQEREVRSACDEMSEALVNDYRHFISSNSSNSTTSSSSSSSSASASSSSSDNFPDLYNSARYRVSKFLDSALTSVYQSTDLSEERENYVDSLKYLFNAQMAKLGQEIGGEEKEEEQNDHKKSLDNIIVLDASDSEEGRAKKKQKTKEVPDIIVIDSDSEEEQKKPEKTEEKKREPKKKQESKKKQEVVVKEKKQDQENKTVNSQAEVIEIEYSDDDDALFIEAAPKSKGQEGKKGPGRPRRKPSEKKVQKNLKQTTPMKKSGGKVGKEPNTGNTVEKKSKGAAKSVGKEEKTKAAERKSEEGKRFEEEISKPEKYARKLEAIFDDALKHFVKFEEELTKVFVDDFDEAQKFRDFLFKKCGPIENPRTAAVFYREAKKNGTLWEDLVNVEEDNLKLVPQLKKFWGLYEAAIEDSSSSSSSSSSNSSPVSISSISSRREAFDEACLEAGRLLAFYLQAIHPPSAYTVCLFYETEIAFRIGLKFRNDVVWAKLQIFSEKMRAQGEQLSQKKSLLRLFWEVYQDPETGSKEPEGTTWVQKYDKGEVGENEMTKWWLQRLIEDRISFEKPVEFFRAFRDLILGVVDFMPFFFDAKVLQEKMSGGFGHWMQGPKRQRMLRDWRNVEVIFGMSQIKKAIQAQYMGTDFLVDQYLSLKRQEGPMQIEQIDRFWTQNKISIQKGQKRRNVYKGSGAGKGLILGQHLLSRGPSKDTVARPNICRALTLFYERGMQTPEMAGKYKPITHIQINENILTQPHIDGINQAESLITCFGSYAAGHFIARDPLDEWTEHLNANYEEKNKLIEQAVLDSEKGKKKEKRGKRMKTRVLGGGGGEEQGEEKEENKDENKAHAAEIQELLDLVEAYREKEKRRKTEIEANSYLDQVASFCEEQNCGIAVESAADKKARERKENEDLKLAPGDFIRRMAGEAAGDATVLRRDLIGPYSAAVYWTGSGSPKIPQIQFGKKVDIRGNLHLVEGQKLHWTEDFTGRRICLVYFKSKAHWNTEEMGKYGFEPADSGGPPPEDLAEEIKDSNFFD